MQTSSTARISCEVEGHCSLHQDTCGNLYCCKCGQTILFKEVKDGWVYYKECGTKIIMSK